MSRTDCIRLALFGSLLIAVLAAYPAGGQGTEATLAPINALREADELPPLAANPALDAVAARYLAAMIDGRCLCPASRGNMGAARLLADVREATGSDAAVLDAALAAGYDQSVGRAIATLARDPANGSAIFGSRMVQIGLATATIEAGRSWLAPPPGREGPEIDLAGYSVVVVVMASAEA